MIEQIFQGQRVRTTSTGRTIVVMRRHVEEIRVCEFETRDTDWGTDYLFNRNFVLRRYLGR